MERDVEIKPIRSSMQHFKTEMLAGWIRERSQRTWWEGFGPSYVLKIINWVCWWIENEREQLRITPILDWVSTRQRRPLASSGVKISSLVWDCSMWDGYEISKRSYWVRGLICVRISSRESLWKEIWSHCIKEVFRIIKLGQKTKEVSRWIRKRLLQS